jgi:hypothetical protein
MEKLLVALGVVAVVGIGGLAFYATAKPGSVAQPNTPEVWECNADAKICPDGSAVGRTGPNCEFTACPSPNATSSILTTYIGGSPTGLRVTVNPKEVVSDSRCAEGVQCVWAGTVEVRTVLSTEVSHGEHVLTLGKPQVFGDFTVTLIEVTPYPKADEEIPVSSYRFTFEVKKSQ